ncbi:MAG: ribosome small subunit-dependent GTPase A [Chloroflexota bacterium]
MPGAGAPPIAMATIVPPVDMPELLALGWNESFGAAWSDLESAGFGSAGRATPGLQPGRIMAGERGSLLVATAGGDVSASIAGRLHHAAEADPEARFPAVGDWVAISDAGTGAAVIQAVLPRASAIVRRGPVDRSVSSQVLAANVDVAFLVTSLNAEFNVRRLERYVAVAWESGALPVVVLSKADLAIDVEGPRVAAAASAPGVEVVVASAVTGQGLDELRRHLGVGRTMVFIGSSGVGKSSLVNALAGAPLLAVASIREDDARGRHTTTRRQLVRLSDGLVIDTPGLRELALLDGDGLAEAFGEIEAIALGCRFRDCRHQTEPGCAIRVAVEDGSLEADRLGAFRKLEREAHRAELATNAVARKAERRKWTAMVKGVGRSMDLKYGRER